MFVVLFPVQDRLGAVLFPFEPRRVASGRFWEPAPARCARLTLGRSKFISQRNPTVKVLPTFQRPDIDTVAATRHPTSCSVRTSTSAQTVDLVGPSHKLPLSPPQLFIRASPSLSLETRRFFLSFISLAFRHLAQAACLLDCADYTTASFPSSTGRLWPGVSYWLGLPLYGNRLNFTRPRLSYSGPRASPPDWLTR